MWAGECIGKWCDVLAPLSGSWKNLTMPKMQCHDPRVVMKKYYVYSLFLTTNLILREFQNPFPLYVICSTVACYLTFTCKAPSGKRWYLFNMSGLFWWSCTVVTMHNFLLPFGWCGFKLFLTSSTVPRHCHATFSSALMRNQDTAALCQEGCTSFPQLPSLLILSLLFYLPSFPTNAVLPHVQTHI